MNLLIRAYYSGSILGMDLNRRETMTELDPQGMLGLIEGFGDQCRTAHGIATSASIQPLSGAPQNVVLTGMGGSAAGGDFARALFEEQGAVPFQVNRDYTMPAFVGPESLVFCASYSGNTEETLAAYEDAKSKGARIIVVTSGGEILRRAQADGYDAIVVPGGQPPRSALGLMLVPVVVACEKLGLLPGQPWEAAFREIDAVAAAYGVDAVDNSAKLLAEFVHGKVTVCYGLGSWQGYIANRWRCQFNENAKFLLFANSYPELDHNEIMGWVAANQQATEFRGIVLEDGTESDAMKTRAAVTEEVIGTICKFHHVQAPGASLLERLLALAHIGDWVSIYLARLNNVDPTQIANIDALKAALAA